MENEDIEKLESKYAAKGVAALVGTILIVCIVYLLFNEYTEKHKEAETLNRIMMDSICKVNYKENIKVKYGVDEKSVYVKLMNDTYEDVFEFKRDEILRDAKGTFLLRKDKIDSKKIVHIFLIEFNEWFPCNINTDYAKDLFLKSFKEELLSGIDIIWLKKGEEMIELKREDVK